ncbi:MAG: hypothetical protein ACRDQ2_01965 [Gaiellales bacterium]
MSLPAGTSGREHQQALSLGGRARHPPRATTWAFPGWLSTPPTNAGGDSQVLAEAIFNYRANVDGPFRAEAEQISGERGDT